MTKHRLPVFDADGHVFEDDDQLIRYYEGPHAISKRNKALSIFPSIDGWARGVIHEREDNVEGRYSHTDAKIWSTMLDFIGAEGSVLFPTAGLAYGLMQDVNFASATGTAYNNWLEDNYTAKDSRLFGAGLLPIEAPEDAVIELRRCATERTNFATMMLPTATATPLKLGHQNYWPIYQEAERLNMPLVLHGGPSAGIGVDFQRPFAKVHTMSHPYPLMLQLTDMIWEGVFDAFPDLRVGFYEAGCTWVPFMMDRLDSEYDSIFGSEARARLKRRPSEYISETDNFWVTAELGEKGLKYAIDAMGSDRIMYASDFPHEPTQDELQGTVPEFLENPAYDEDAKAKILYGNAMRFYGLDERVSKSHAVNQAATVGEDNRVAMLERRIVDLENRLSQAKGAKAPPAQPLMTQQKPYEVRPNGADSYYWCSCGRSASQPFCDGSHKGTGMKPVEVKIEGSDAVYLCGCRQSANKPFCDGAHKKI
jgi:uncharacterized protein